MNATIYTIVGRDTNGLTVVAHVTHRPIGRIDVVNGYIACGGNMVAIIDHKGNVVSL